MKVITVEVMCPSTSRKYDYRMPIKMKAGDIKKQIIEDIRFYEGMLELFENTNDINLFCERCMIDDNVSLEEAGVKNGDTLMLI